MRLGALEILANIFSGRITANDKDPFPHQLALQQHVKAKNDEIKRLLIADEVGLGKTIEIGLVLRDLLISQGRLDQFRCLYLTKAGLREDASAKLKAVMKGAIDGQHIVEVVDSFRNYGGGNINGIHVASMDAARRYVSQQQKNRLSDSLVNPDIVIIDECHYCSCDIDLTNAQQLTKATQTYQAAYQLITGKFWKQSTPPALVVLMSATPFRSRTHFSNLLRLLTHQNTEPELDAFNNVSEAELVSNLQSEKSQASIIWRQQTEALSWTDQPLFPNLTVERVRLQSTYEYLSIIKKICQTVEKICKNHGTAFGGFAKRHLQVRLTSSSIAGACWIFRWCVRHQSWKTEKEYKQDASSSTENLRKLIIGLSQRLAQFDRSAHADVYFPSDRFTFEATSLAQGGGVAIYKFSESLRRGDDEEEDDGFIATESEILELSRIGLKLLALSSAEDNSSQIENTKLNWLKEALEKYQESKFLVFTESLQTCEIITKTLPKISEKLTGSMSNAERETVIRKFRGLENPAIRVLVATSAADEGFDFQVANRVIHWDLSSSPAVLMQRNGRVARLGQISDVTAYYLTIQGTHEERREMALHQRFSELGIHDEQLRLRILGEITEDIEEQIFRAVENDESGIVGNILRTAKDQNDEMQNKLKELQKTLQVKSVIDRRTLEKRLKVWADLGLPEGNELELRFREVEWQRPVFRIGGESTMEPAKVTVASIHRGDRRRRPLQVIFDPEFNLFGGRGNEASYTLAGLRPWVKQERQSAETEVWKHRPLSDADPIGELAATLSRQRHADFTVLQATTLCEQLPDLGNARYLLFATHPLLEVEIHPSEYESSYLTFYAFDNDLTPLRAYGYSATDVNKVISLLESEAKKSAKESGRDVIDQDVVNAAQQAGIQLAKWLDNSRILPTMTRHRYFLPIPVALVFLI